MPIASIYVFERRQSDICLLRKRLRAVVLFQEIMTVNPGDVLDFRSNSTTNPLSDCLVLCLLTVQGVVCKLSESPWSFMMPHIDRLRN